MGKGDRIGGCESYKYLGVRVSKDGEDKVEIKERIAQGRRVISRLKSIWWHKDISKGRKMQIYNTVVKSIVLYGVETWRWTQNDKKRLTAMKMDVW